MTAAKVRSRATGKRAVGYVRVSSVGGRAGDSFISPDVQREKIEAWAAYRGYSVDRFYIDLDESGRTMKRPEFERMMADARSGAFDVVAVYRLTRFARNIKGASIALDELVEHGVDLVSVTEDLDTTTAGGKLMRNMLLAMAEFESERIGEEWRNVHASRRERGIAHVANGLYGYVAAGAAIQAVNEEEAEAVRLMFDMRQRGASHGAIRHALFDRGFRPRRGGIYFGLSTIKFMLANPLYAGVMRVDGELVAARHEGLVSLDQWRAVNALRKRLIEAPNERKALLSGIVVCSGCGYALKYERRGKGRKTMYRCHTRRTMSSGCPQGTAITADALEEYVVQALLLSRARFKRQQKAAMERGAAARRRHEARLAEIGRTLDQLTTRLGAADGLVADEYERQVRRLVAERAMIEEVIAEARAEAASVIDLPTEETWATMPLAKRREIIRGLVRRIVISPAASQGGNPDRLIDFEARVRFELTLDDHATAAAVGRALYDAINLSEGVEHTPEGPVVSVDPQIVASPFFEG
jgi:site-specific DNA recombinase